MECYKRDKKSVDISGAGGRRERLFVGDWILMSAVDRLLPFLLSPHFVDPSHDHPSPTQQSALLSSIQLCHTSSGHCSAFIKFNTCLTKVSWSHSVERWMCFQNPNMSVPLLIVPQTFANIPCNYGWAGSCLARLEICAKLPTRDAPGWGQTQTWDWPRPCILQIGHSGGSVMQIWKLWNILNNQSYYPPRLSPAWPWYRHWVVIC